MKTSRLSAALALSVILPFATMAATSAIAKDEKSEGGMVKGAAKGAAAGAVLPGVSAKTGAKVGAVTGGVKKVGDKKEDKKDEDKQEEGKQKKQPDAAQTVIEQQVKAKKIRDVKMTKIENMINVIGKEFDKSKTAEADDVFADPTKSLPRNPSKLSVFHPEQEVETNLNKWEKERLMLLSWV